MSRRFLDSSQILNQAFDEEDRAIRVSGDSAVENATGGRALVMRISEDEETITYRRFVVKYSSRIRTLRIVR